MILKTYRLADLLTRLCGLMSRIAECLTALDELTIVALSEPQGPLQLQLTVSRIPATQKVREEYERQRATDALIAALAVLTNPLERR